MADYGFVYCLGNDCMPGVYKIGMTDRSPSKRCEELSASTSIPLDFEVLFFIECLDPRTIERSLHNHFWEHRVSPNREFFKCDLRLIHRQFEIYGEDGAPFAMTNTASSELAMLDFNGPIVEKEEIHEL